MRASTLWFPENTAAQTRSCSAISALSCGLRSPELPMQVVQLGFERDAHRHRQTAHVGELLGQRQ